MAVNKVVLSGKNGDEVIVDLTNDSVTSNFLFQGKTAHDKTGNVIIGSYVKPTFITVHTGNTDPSTSLGVDGDIYLKKS